MGHNHHHDTVDYTRAFAIGVLLNVVFVVIEGVYGLLSGSLALIADAGHNLSDVVSLLLAWGASVLATKSTTEKRTYGFRKATVMASLVSAILLLLALGGIAWEAIGRFRHPQPVEGLTVIVVAAIGVVINTLTALLFVRGQQHDLNIRGAFLHMAADAAVSLGVVVAGLLILTQGWVWIDPVVSLLIVGVIFIGTWALLKDSVNYVIDAVPDSIDLAAIRDFFLEYDHVSDLHDLHVWPLSASEIALTVHLVVSDDALDNRFLTQLQERLHDEFGIAHSTIQVESSAGEQNCMLDRQHCI